MTVRLSAPDGAARLDQLLRDQLAGYSREQVRRLLRDGLVRVDGEVVRTGKRVLPGARIEVLVDAPAELPLAAPELPLSLVYADDAVLVADKPAGMPTLPLAPHERHTLANALVARHPELRAVGGPPLEAGLLHRLDNETSGVLVAARTAAAYQILSRRFAAGEGSKTYLALVSGSPPEAGVIELELAHDPARPERMLAVTDPGQAAQREARPARTEYRVRERLPGAALLEVVIHRGARHQIRVHLAALGHPIAGDRLYGPAAAPRPAERHFLHAAAVCFEHPSGGREVRAAAPLPDELEKWLAQMRKVL